MLAAAVGSFQQAAGRSCAKVEYKYPLDPTESGGCHAPVGPGDTTFGTEPDACHGDMNICNGPDHISKFLSPPCSFVSYLPRLSFVLSFFWEVLYEVQDWLTSIWQGVELAGSDGPYTNHMNVRVSFEIGDGKHSAFNEFICEMVIEGLAMTVNALAPELAAVDWISADELQEIVLHTVNGPFALAARAPVIFFFQFFFGKAGIRVTYTCIL
ncbi:hypothetical protein MPH_00153 [Macrophomina phaseolina MS6]|uniref:Uncharacterized protein n=1 Tax=Macrophomina phaseolina (strain MS6) TaxID=1126212 RepID=K2SIZ1_MACPH|nr:hypothetical protein MPH_00153 [Macrophomina phaseolina MS6]